MFPARLLRGIDLAIEFATLGEYGLVPVPAPVTPAGFSVDLSGIGGSQATSGRLAPATPAARRLEAAREARPASKPPLSTPLASRRVLRSNTFGPAHRPAPRMRKRAGAAPARPQPCLVAEAERERPGT
jgi:hypothetical protein